MTKLVDLCDGSIKMTKLVDLCEEGSITNDETGWFMWRFDNKWRNWLIYGKKVR